MSRLWARGLLLAYLLVVLLCLSTFGVYYSEARRLVGANYTAMVTDLVRAQHDPDRLRLILESLLDRPDPLHLEQLRDLIWRIPLRIQGLDNHLRRSDLPPRDYRPFVKELADVEGRLSELEQVIDRVGRDSTLTQQEAHQLRELGLDIEESLAWSYSELNQLLHEASADQRHFMQRLTLTGAVLMWMLLVAIGGVLLMLWRLQVQSEAMQRLSLTDQLTGVGNRRRLLQEAEGAFARRERGDEPLALVLLDLDHFKRFNDTYGHPLGDEVLVRFSRLLQESVRRMDVVARMGGEEFAILMPHSDLDAAHRLANRLLEAVGQMPMPGAVATGELSVSIGIAEASEQDDFDRLYARADRRLYRAKELGRDRVEWVT
ncbi:GGDEF domain-containing protein [Halomonas sp. KAO]|uniref:GGDEF domain-containing protein n=1 Tax=Halomonas sp. KAO TaxID=2783858 RepID=UPI00189E5431|nr:GGDEF domain-containing protein [Halomonas sp. KAO]MBF7052701.1 GGDEF domain-containing protein [Halomonas sp. KAO]